MKKTEKQRTKPGPKPRPPEEIGKNRVVRFNDEDWEIVGRAAGGPGKRSEFIRKAAVEKAKRALR